jgi:hypothetical protein
LVTVGLCSMTASSSRRPPQRGQIRASIANERLN